MYAWNHKSSLKETKPRENTQIPSFSSTLLDEIYRSMEFRDQKSVEIKLQDENFLKKQSGGGATNDDGITNLRRAFLVQKWLDMKVNAKNFTRRRRSSSLPENYPKSVLGNDPFLFGSSLSTSYTMSSEPGDFYHTRSQKQSCFGPKRPKQVKTDVNNCMQMEFDYCVDDSNQTERIKHGRLIKSKAQALKIYANLKRAKEPISPGGRLSTFLNSLFTNGHHLKKLKDLNNQKVERTTKSAHGSTCSSVSSFTRSCLSKDSPRSREKRLNNGNVRRTVRFYPVSVIFDEDCRPCGEKYICSEQDILKVHVTSMSQKFDDDDEEEDDDDMKSDASSDLFELDHLSILKECEELPVYETTHFGMNQAIANGFIC
ncbi:protein BIG GRAIN 1-like A [Rutidosis leptorrhynchoides]|uniref:protein BIG GRAIN 1-like A n=1 Tax=Rutidosis leptorrhynchoides TaxID=125765 RepID=UPI003A992788